MAQRQSPKTGEKRGPGRPPKDANESVKRRKLPYLATESPLSSTTQIPAIQSPASASRAKAVPGGLPAKVSDHRPLPTLAEPQSVSLAKEEYQSIAASAVIHASLDRSRLRWVHEGIFERYWVKPESGKNARPPPPNNPDVKLQKHKGACRIRIEPHILEAELYVEEKPPQQVKQVKQYVAPAVQSQAGHQYKHQPYVQQPHHSQTLPPIQHTGTGQTSVGNTLPHISSMSQSPAHSQPPASRAQPSTSQPQPEKKQDPVISMLATRASSDPELKALMKEVATGNANPDQLKIFQGHIDELTKTINEKKKKEDEDAATGQASTPTAQQDEVIQYDGPSESGQAANKQAQQRLYQKAQPVYQHQHIWSPQSSPAPAPIPVPKHPTLILAFTTTGATEDRFLFPQNSILESLSPQHLLVSFLVTRKGREAADAAGVDPETEYWQAVTLMVEVAYNREYLIECVRRWVKPAEEVRKHMEDVMARCTRAPDTYLALRLPFKAEAIDESKEGTPVRFVEESTKPKKTVKYVKKATAPIMKVEPTKHKPDTVDAVPTALVTPLEGPADSLAAQVDGAADAEKSTTADSGRPKRAVRKSVRISEG